MLRIVGCFGSGKKRKRKGRKEKRKEKIQRQKWKDVQTYRQGRKEGRERKGGRREREEGSEQGVLCPLGGQRAQGLAAVGFTLSYRVRLHLNPSLLPVSPGPC